MSNRVLGPPVTFDVELMRRDMAAHGWLPTDLARKARLSDMAVSNFLRGRYQNPRTALKLARALNAPPHIGGELPRIGGHLERTGEREGQQHGQEMD